MVNRAEHLSSLCLHSKGKIGDQHVVKFCMVIRNRIKIKQKGKGRDKELDVEGSQLHQ